MELMFFKTGKAFAYMDEVEFGIDLINNGQTISLTSGFSLFQVISAPIILI